MIAVALALAVAAFPILGGTAATYVARTRFGLRCRLAMGTSLGLAVLGLAALAVGTAAGLTTGTVIVAALVASTPLILLAAPTHRQRLRSDLALAWRRLAGGLSGSDREARAVLAVSVVWAIVLWALFGQAVFQDAAGLHTASYASRADLPFHVGIIASFANGGVFPPQHPEFAGAALTYPFLADLVAAVFQRAGAALPLALFIENILLALALVTLIECWTFELTRDRVAALFAPPLVLLGATLGWMLIPGDLWRSGTNPAWFFAHLPRAYSIRAADLEWGNLATIFLVPQRSLMLGLPLVLTVLLLWWRAVDVAGPADGQATAAESRRLMILAGVAAGLLPLAHTHSFAVVMMTGAVLVVLFPRWRAWAAFFAVALLLALPQLWAVLHGNQARASSFVGWSPGWSKGSQPFLWFWFKNTGLFIPLLVAGLLMRPKSPLESKLRRFYLPFVLCFIIPNLFRLAPRIWDNNKVLVYWYVASAPVVALVLARLWNRRRIARLVSVCLLVSVSLSGLLDVWRVISGVATITVFDAPSVAFADLLRRDTEGAALVVRAPTATHPVMLAGRQSVLGWAPRVQSHGIETGDRESDVRAAYEGTLAPTVLVDRYGADYLVVGPAERGWVKVDERLDRLPLVGEAGGYRLYRLRPPSANSSLANR